MRGLNLSVLLGGHKEGLRLPISLSAYKARELLGLISRDFQLATAFGHLV